MSNWCADPDQMVCDNVLKVLTCVQLSNFAIMMGH